MASPWGTISTRSTVPTGMPAAFPVAGQNLQAATIALETQPATFISNIRDNAALAVALATGLATQKLSGTKRLLRALLPTSTPEPELSPDKKLSFKNEILSVVQRALIYSGPVQALEIDGLVKQRLNAEDSVQSPFYNPDGDIARLSEMDWTDWSASNLVRLGNALYNEVPARMGRLYYMWLGVSRNELMASPDLQVRLDHKGDFEGGWANFLKIAGQLWLSAKTKGKTGFEKYTERPLAAAKNLLPYVGLTGFQNALSSYDALAPQVASEWELAERACWHEVIADTGADPLERAQALTLLMLSNIGVALANGLKRQQAGFDNLASEICPPLELTDRARWLQEWHNGESAIERLGGFSRIGASNMSVALRHGFKTLQKAPQVIRQAMQREKQHWHGLFKDDIETVFQDALGTQFKLSAGEKALAWSYGMLAGMGLHEIAAPLALFRQGLYFYMGYRWVPALGRKTWVSLNSPNRDKELNVTKDFLLQIGLFSGKSVLALNSILTTLCMGAAQLYSGQQLTFKMVYDESIQAARESPPFLNISLSAFALSLTGAGLYWQTRDALRIATRMYKGEPAPSTAANTPVGTAAQPDPDQLTNGALLLSSSIGIAGALCNCLGVIYLGSYSNGPIFMFWTGASGACVAAQTAVKYHKRIGRGVRNALARWR